MKVNNQELRITPASFEDAIALQRAVGKAVKDSKLNIDLKDGKDFLNQEATGDTIGTLLNAVISIGISKEVEDCLFKCCERALLGEEKIDKNFFEKIENREFYFPILIEVGKVNLAPFLRGLFSQFSDLGEKVKNILK